MPMPTFVNIYINYDKEMYVDADVEFPMPDTLFEWFGEVSREGIRIALKYNSDRSSYIASATGEAGSQGYKDGWVLTAFGGSPIGAFHKLWLILEVYGGKASLEVASEELRRFEADIRTFISKEFGKGKRR